MRIQSPVTDTSTVSTTRATSTGCTGLTSWRTCVARQPLFFVSNRSNKTSTDPAEILRSSQALEVSSKDATLPSCRTQPLSFASQLEADIPDFQCAELIPELWESLRFPQSAGSNTNFIVQRLEPLRHKGFVSKACRICKLFGHRRGAVSWGFPKSLLVSLSWGYAPSLKLAWGNLYPDQSEFRIQNCWFRNAVKTKTQL